MMEWFVKGRRFPALTCEVIEGVDRDAKLVVSDYDPSRRCFTFLMEHPDWPNCEPVPIVDIFVRVHYEDLKLDPFEKWAENNIEEEGDE